MSNPTCSIDECDRKVLARNLCGLHYGREQRRKVRGICSVDGCSSPIRHREWCNAHYQKVIKYGDPLADHSQKHVDTPCSVEDCEQLVIAKGLCKSHYERARTGSPITDTPIRDYFVTDDLAERLAHYTPPGAPDECWEWQASTNKGYGVFTVHGSRVRVAHVVAWELHHGQPLPPGMVVRHHCDNPPCCNPAHLELGTHADNSDDKVSRNRQAEGVGHGLAILTDDDIREIRELCAAGQFQRVVGERFGISQSHVSQIVRRVIWDHVE